MKYPRRPYLPFTFERPILVPFSLIFLQTNSSLCVCVLLVTILPLSAKSPMNSFRCVFINNDRLLTSVTRSLPHLCRGTFPQPPLCSPTDSLSHAGHLCLHFFVKERLFKLWSPNWVCGEGRHTWTPTNVFSGHHIWTTFDLSVLTWLCVCVWTLNNWTIMHIKMRNLAGYSQIQLRKWFLKQ